METSSLLIQLKDSGCRITRTRRAVLGALAASRVLLSADDLRRSLAGRGLKVNKTTVYRELAFLTGRNILHEIHLGDGTVRYRVCPATHHHHVICLKCRRAEDVALEGGLRELEDDIGQSKGFRVLHHTLEFFGVCPDCDVAERAGTPTDGSGGGIAAPPDGSEERRGGREP